MSSRNVYSRIIKLPSKHELSQTVAEKCREEQLLSSHGYILDKGPVLGAGRYSKVRAATKLGSSIKVSSDDSASS